MSRYHPSYRTKFKIVFRCSAPTLTSRQLVFEAIYMVKVPLQGLVPSLSGFVARAQSLEVIELLLKPV